MNKHQFLQQRLAAWQRFEQLIDRRNSRGRLRWSAAEVTEFSRLLREISNDLAIIRSRDWGQSLVTYLNPLVARGHNLFYRSPPSAWRPLWEFITVGFPQVFRRYSMHFLAAFTLFFLPLAIAWIAVQQDPTRALRIIPAAQLDQFDQMYGDNSEDASSDLLEKPAESGPTESSGESSTQQPVADDASQTTSGPGDRSSDSEHPDETAGEKAAENLFSDFGEERAGMAGFYIRNNVGIALQCFARGILLGIGTMSTLLLNGIVLGGVAGYVLSLGHAEKFLSFVVSHGSFELTAIAIAGGAGLILGDAFVHPGQRTRLEALRVRGLDAVKIAGGAAGMLVIAALIEAFWSPADIPAVVKYVVGSILWLVVALYLGLAGARR